ncbi:DUF5340 domain-containing protein [Microseira wollei]|uniref:DUF5340 domain-containing protein n=2 Tax=Microseira TaxID=1609595 RepID=A0AAV3XE41_9CYAN|nr:DUF5340 domain-containing protein [Microseira wollei]GET38380.1 hypothetical protein MiSe_31360 [Microseira wollei NIES-4236]
MEQIPLPSPIHYELVLQMLERQTMFAVTGTPAMREKVQQLIVTMRKAAAQQKQLEEIFQQAGLQVDYRWSLNHVNSDPNSPSDRFPMRQSPPA